MARDRTMISSHGEMDGVVRRTADFSDSAMRTLEVSPAQSPSAEPPRESNW